MAMVKRAERIAELQAQIESAKAEIKQLQADEQVEKAEAKESEAKMGFAESVQNRNLSGNRDSEGNFMPENTSGKPMELKPDLGESNVSSATRKRTKEEEEIYKALMEGKELTDEQYEITNQMSIEDFEETGIPLVDLKVFTEGEEEVEEEPRIDMLGKPDEKPEEGEPRFAGIDRDEGRAEADTRPEQRTMGFETSEGGIMSVNEKDDFWKTQEGYDKALEMYGRKPAWIKEPTLVWNAEEQRYDAIQNKDEFEDFTTPSMSADIKRLFG